MSALPAPATRTITPASRLTSGPYTPFEGSASIGVSEDTGESPMLSDALKDLFTNRPEVNIDTGGLGGALGDAFEKYLLAKTAKDILTRKPPVGGPVITDGSGKTPKKYTPVPTQPSGPQIKRPPRPVPKPPSTLKRLLTSVKSSTIRPGRLGLVGAGLIGLSEYAESGDATRAVTKGVVQGASTWAGAAAGASAGAMLGSVIPGVGTAIGGILGGLGGGILGGSLSEKPAEILSDFVSDPVKATKDVYAKIKAKLEPMAQDRQSKIISDLTGENQELYANPNVPNIVIPSINQSAPAKQEINYLMPQASARNTESTLEKFLNRNFF